MQTPQTWIWQHADWPNFQWSVEKVSAALARARLAQGKVLGAVRILDPGLSLEAVASILVEDGMTTSAIEGEQLPLDAVRSSVARHLGLPTAGLPTPPRPVDGLIEVLLDATRQYAVPLTESRLYAWQAALFPTGYSGLHAIRTGELRGDAPMQVVSGRIGYEKVHFTAPSRDGLEAELARFLAWFNQPTGKIDGLIRAGLAHLWFVTLHPFEDGNGRLTRAITDMALCQDEQQAVRFFSLSAQILREREHYYTILENTQRGELDVSAWLIWFLNQVEAAAAAETTVARTLAKARFWLRHRQTGLNARQMKTLNRLLDAGPGGFAGGINTQKYASLTKTSRATAYRELADLLEKGCLTPTGKGGRSSAYDIAWPSHGFV